MELVLLAVWCFLVAFGGGLVGLVLGNLRLPVVLLIASSPAAGAGANIAISAVAAGTAATAHIRAGRIHWRLFAWMAPPSIVGALIGGYVSGVLPKRVLLGVISVVLFHASYELFVRPPAPAPNESGHIAKGAAVATGAIVGFLGGVVGLILGSLRMPAMLRYLRVPARRAAATNVTVGFCVGVAGAIGHLPSAAPDWTVAAVGAAASIPGAVIGSRLTGRLAEPQLIRTIAWILLVVAVSTTVQAVA
jgi:uncharacterized membrane protein YfcA